MGLIRDFGLLPILHLTFSYVHVILKMYFPVSHIHLFLIISNIVPPTLCGNILSHTSDNFRVSLSEEKQRIIEQAKVAQEQLDITRVMEQQQQLDREQALFQQEQFQYKCDLDA